jgi:DNA-binding IclR family transcriptional regulator
MQNLRRDSGTMSKIIDRTPDFIELFGKERRPLSLSEIANLLDIPISSCQDVVQAMQIAWLLV